MALLHWLAARRGHATLIACHLNHGLRGNDSGQDAALVRRLAKKLGVECEVEKIDTQCLAEQSGESIETAARRARHEFFARMAEKHGTALVYLAHHAEDQAETVLAHLCRGAGLNGLSGMKSEQALDNGLHLRRPLLSWRRGEINDYIRRHKLPFRDDASNDSDLHRRNRLRHEVLPLLGEIFDRDVSGTIASLAEHVVQDEAALQAWLDQVWQDLAPMQEDGSLKVTEALKKLPQGLLRRLLRRWLRDELHIPDLGHAEIEAACELLEELEPAKANLPGDRHLRRKAKRLWVE